LHHRIPCFSIATSLAFLRQKPFLSSDFSQQCHFPSFGCSSLTPALSHDPSHTHGRRWLCNDVCCATFHRAQPLRRAADFHCSHLQVHCTLSAIHDLDCRSRAVLPGLRAARDLALSSYCSFQPRDRHCSPASGQQQTYHSSKDAKICLRSRLGGQSRLACRITCCQRWCCHQGRLWDWEAPSVL